MAHWHVSREYLLDPPPSYRGKLSFCRVEAEWNPGVARPLAQVLSV